MSADFLIVGAGVAGLSTALELAGRGARVAMVERGVSGKESTWAGAGILSPLLPWDYSGELHRLCEYSRSLFGFWCAELQGASGVDPEFNTSGMLVLPPWDSSLAEQWCQAHGWRYERVEGVDDPVVCPDAALWLPDVAQVRNPCLIRALRAALARMNVELREGLEVLGLDTMGDRVRGVKTGRGPISADVVVVTAGAWTADLIELAGMEERIFPVRGQMLLFRRPRGEFTRVVYDNGHYIVPRADGHVLVGSTLEHVGFDRSTTLAAREELLGFLASRAPTLARAEVVRQWSGLRPGSPGNVPVIGPHPGYRNLYLNAGHYRYGVTMAPGSAKLLADLIFSEKPSIPMEPYSFDVGVSLGRRV